MSAWALIVAWAASALAEAPPPGAFVVVAADTWLRLEPRDDAPGLREPARGPVVLRVIRAEGEGWLYVETRGMAWGAHCQRTHWSFAGPLIVRAYVPTWALLDVLERRVTLDDLEVTADAGALVGPDGRLVDGWLLPVKPPPGNTSRWYLTPDGARVPGGGVTAIEAADAAALRVKVGGDPVIGLASNVWYKPPVGGEPHGWLRSRCVTVPYLPPAGVEIRGAVSSPVGPAPADPSLPSVAAETPLTWEDGRPAGAVRAPWTFAAPPPVAGRVCVPLSLPGVEEVCGGAACPLRVCVAADAVVGLAPVAGVKIVEPASADHVRVDAWRSALDQRAAAFSACGDEAWGRRPGAAGEVSIAIAADSDGTIVRAVVLRDGVGDPDLARCVQAAVEALRVPTDGEAAALVQTFWLSP
ncbi:MAG TPA: hypothetical protein PKA64_23560 [Myxococcota bacterium]|nr:hypothetical protein [Myxococcota bacterium]